MLKKFIVRRDLISTVHHLDQFRIAILSLQSAIVTGEYWTAYGGARHITEIYEPAILDRVLATFPKSIPEDLGSCISRLANLLEYFVSQNSEFFQGLARLIGMIYETCDKSITFTSSEGGSMAYWREK